MSTQIQYHESCAQHGLMDASDCRVCQRLRRQCGLKETEDHTSCAGAQTSQMVRITKEEYEEFKAYREAQLKELASKVPASVPTVEGEVPNAVS